MSGPVLLMQTLDKLLAVENVRNKLPEKEQNLHIKKAQQDGSISWIYSVLLLPNLLALFSLPPFTCNFLPSNVLSAIC